MKLFNPNKCRLCNKQTYYKNCSYDCNDCCIHQLQDSNTKEIEVTNFYYKSKENILNKKDSFIFTRYSWQKHYSSTKIIESSQSIYFKTKTLICLEYFEPKLFNLEYFSKMLPLILK